MSVCFLEVEKITRRTRKGPSCITAINWTKPSPRARGSAGGKRPLPNRAPEMLLWSPAMRQVLCLAVLGAFCTKCGPDIWLGNFCNIFLACGLGFSPKTGWTQARGAPTSVGVLSGSRRCLPGWECWGLLWTIPVLLITQPGTSGASRE